jgi:hypothetical protein
MFLQSFKHLMGEVEPLTLGITLLEDLHDPEALLVMIEPALILHEAVERFLSGVAERRMSQVMGKGDGFRKVFIQTECPCDRSADRSNLDRMGESGAVMIPLAVKEDLGLAIQASEGGAVDNAVAVPLVAGSEGMLRFR